MQGNRQGSFKNRVANGRRISLKGVQSLLGGACSQHGDLGLNFGYCLPANKTWKETVSFFFVPQNEKNKNNKKKNYLLGLLEKLLPLPHPGQASLAPPPPNKIRLWGAWRESLPGIEPHGKHLGRFLPNFPEEKAQDLKWSLWFVSLCCPVCFGND